MIRALGKSLTRGPRDDFMKALSVQGEEREKRIQAFVDANSGVTKEALRYYVD